MPLAKSNISDGVALTTARKILVRLMSVTQLFVVEQKNMLNYSLYWIITFTHNLSYLFQKTLFSPVISAVFSYQFLLIIFKKKV